MTFRRVFSAFLLPICWLFLSAAEDVIKTTSGRTTMPRAAVNASTNGTNVTHGVGGKNGHEKSLRGFSVDSSMVQRALYVLIGITIIGVLYFLIRAVRLKKPAQRKKYGLLSNYDDSVEMEAVESDEDDTLYEARSLRR